MAMIDTYSKRKKRRAGQQDPYQYAELPGAFRTQVIHIWRSAIGSFGNRAFDAPSPSNQAWVAIHDLLARELGVFELTAEGYGPQEKCERFLLEAETDQALDLIELSFRIIEHWVPKLEYWQRQTAGIDQEAESAVAELNGRFREHAIGYQYVDGIIVELDSDYLHDEVVRPALSLLHEEAMSGPAQEFLGAHEHYRHGRNKEAIGEALKAFESTMKSICDARSWLYPPGATAKPLLDILLAKGLVPSELQSHFSALRGLLESGLTTVRNTTSGHGQGKLPITVPDYIVAYALHLAASNIVFLVQAHRAPR